jgi:hypothetical protein
MAARGADLACDPPCDRAVRARPTTLPKLIFSMFLHAARVRTAVRARLVTAARTLAVAVDRCAVSAARRIARAEKRTGDLSTSTSTRLSWLHRRHSAALSCAPTLIHTHRKVIFMPPKAKKKKAASKSAVKTKKSAAKKTKKAKK